jgi:hypothetical protein
MYGGLLLDLEDRKLWPRRTAKTLTLTVNELAAKLKEIYLQISSDCNHYCNYVVNFRQSVGKALNADHEPTLPCHLNHLKDANNGWFQ